MRLLPLIFIFLSGPSVKESTSFWGLKVESQLGYEIYDQVANVKALLSAITTAAYRPNVLQRNQDIKSAFSALSFLANNLRNCQYFYDTIAAAAVGRSWNEKYFMSRIISSRASCNQSLAVLSNSTSQLTNLNPIIEPKGLIGTIQSIQKLNINATIIFEAVTQSVSLARNGTSFTTPDLLNSFMDLETVNQLRNFFNSTVNSYNEILENVNDAGRVLIAYGSVYDMLYTTDLNAERMKNNSMLNFMNYFKTQQAYILRNVESYALSSLNGFNSFIQRVRNAYRDDIVLPTFENDQLSAIHYYMSIITQSVFNPQLMNATFEAQKAQVASIYGKYRANEANLNFTEYVDVIIGLLRTSYSRNYSTEIDQLVSQAMREISHFSNGHAYCIDERTANLKIFMPTIASWFATIRNTIGAVLRELQYCLSSQMNIDARRSTSKCLQIQVNNMSNSYEALRSLFHINLTPVGENAVHIFTNCLNAVNSNFTGSFKDMAKKAGAVLNI